MKESGAANPWLRVPAMDYEGHMAHPSVNQLDFLRSHFWVHLMAARPRRLAVLGCATGNGLECVPPAEVELVLAVDINPEYLALAEARYRPRLGERLDLRCADLDDPQAAAAALAPGNFDLIYAALLFEYVDPARLLPVLAPALAPRGVLVSMLQLPSPELPAVSATPFLSLRVLEPFMELRSPAELDRLAAAAGLAACERGQVLHPAGKRFELFSWRRAGEAPADRAGETPADRPGEAPADRAG